MSYFEEGKKRINSMADFANLFLAIYSLKFNSEDDNVYLPVNFKEVLENSIFTIYRNLSSINSDILYDENGNFKINEFLDKLKLSTTKKYWREEFLFDLSKNMVWTRVTKDNIKEKIDSYVEENVLDVEKIVDSFFEVANLNINKNIDNNERNYTLIYKKSDD